jgi:hypothetical protein
MRKHGPVFVPDERGRPVQFFQAKSAKKIGDAWNHFAAHTLSRQSAEASPLSDPQGYFPSIALFQAPCLVPAGGFLVSGAPQYGEVTGNRLFRNSKIPRSHPFITDLFGTCGSRARWRGVT